MLDIEVILENDKCPHCEWPITTEQAIVDKLIEAGKLPKEATARYNRGVAVLANPMGTLLGPGVKIPVNVMYYAGCANCGAMYYKKVELRFCDTDPKGNPIIDLR